MANFEQPVQGQVGTYLNSRPIDRPQPIPAGSPATVDTSMEALFKGIGQMFTNVATGADTLIKEDIKDNLYKDLDAERGKFTSELSQYSKDIGGPGQPGNQARNNSEGMNAYAQAGPDAEDDVPDEVTGLGDQVSNLTAARAGGKISPTQYWLAIDNIAKDYRSRYAGHRDYIDATISAITGHNPANAYMSSIMSDLNYALRGQATKQDPMVKTAQSALTALAKDGHLPDSQVQELYAKTQTDPVGVMRTVNTLMFPKHQNDVTGWEYQARLNKIDDATITARTAVPQYVTNQVWADLDSHLQFNGLTMSDIQKKMADMAANPDKADPQQVIKLAMAASQLRYNSEVNTRKWLETPVGANGESRAQIAAGRNIDPGKYVNDLIKERYQVFDNVVQNLVNKSPQLATYQSEIMQAQATNNKYNALKTDFGAHLQMMELLQNYPEDMKEYMKTILKNNYGDPNINVFVKDMMASFMTGRTSGKLVTIDEAIKKAQAAGVTDPKVYSDFAHFGEQVMNPKLSTDSKVNIAASMFNPRNFAFLSNFKEDKVIEDGTGVYRMAPGKYSIWQTYTTPAFAAEIAKIAKERPEVGVWYKNWVQSGFGSDIFGPQIRDMQKILSDPSTQLTYNNITNQFNPPDRNADDFWTRYANKTRNRAGVNDQVDNSITLLNEGLRGLANEAATRGITEPAAVQAYLLGQLKGLGIVPPEARPVRDPKTVAEHLINAFLHGARQFNPLAGRETK